jgi:hypothetical protein
MFSGKGHPRWLFGFTSGFGWKESEGFLTLLLFLRARLAFLTTPDTEAEGSGWFFGFVKLPLGAQVLLPERVTTLFLVASRAIYFIDVAIQHEEVFLIIPQLVIALAAVYLVDINRLLFEYAFIAGLVIRFFIYRQVYLAMLNHLLAAVALHLADG